MPSLTLHREPGLQQLRRGDSVPRQPGRRRPIPLAAALLRVGEWAVAMQMETLDQDTMRRPEKFEAKR